MSDPFDPVSVHGVWPLVGDPSHAGGIRFAEIGRDEPSDCLTSPDALPDAAVEIRLFPTAEARDAWCAAVGEFGGNAVHATPLRDDEMLAALLVRHDRERTVGTSLESCIAFHGSLPPYSEYSRSRARHAMASDARDRAWRQAWATEIDAVSRVEGLRIDEHFHDPSPSRLIIDRRGGGLGRAVWVEPAAEGRRVTLRMGEQDALDLGDPELTRSLREAIASLDYALDGHDDPHKVVPVADEPALRAVMDDLARLGRIRADLQAVLVRRSLVKAATEGRPGGILRRLVDGFPVAKAPASSSYAYQVNPVSGAAVDVDGYALQALWKAGALLPVWWSNRIPKPSKDKPLDAFEASLWFASPLGIALANSEAMIQDLAERQPAALAQALVILTGMEASPEFAEATRTVRPATPWSVPTHEFAPTRIPGGKRLPKRAKDLALLAAWQVHGLTGG